jgi:hypothetical protein
VAAYGVRFELLPPGQKRHRYRAWAVRTRAGVLGEVRWLARIKRYVLVPRVDVPLTLDTLREVAAFIAHRESGGS